MKKELNASQLSLGNTAFRNQEYASAIAHYQQALIDQPKLKDIIDLNITIGQSRQYKIQSSTLKQQRHGSENSRSADEEPLTKSEDSEKDNTYTSDEHETIYASGRFSNSYYLETYPDIAVSGMDPLEHYCRYGWQENRNPNFEFNTHYYLGKNPDVAQAGMNPFAHWIKYGQFEHRKTTRIEVDPNQSFKPNQPTVIFLSHEASQTGAPAVLMTLMRWVKKNTNIKFSIVIGSQGVWNDRFEEIAPCFYLDGVHKNGFTNELRDFCGSNVQAVYVNTIASGLHAEHLKYLGAEFIAHVHEMENVFQIYEASFSALRKLCNKFIAVSQGSVDALKRRVSKGAEISFFKPFIEPGDKRTKTLLKSRGNKIIFGCGAVERRKGFDIFCEVAVQLLNSGFKDFKMYWIGSADKKDLDPKSEVESRDLTGYVEWLGPKDNPRDYFNSGDLFLLPSREDPYPLVCMEAAESGLPVVCFDESAGGMHSFVEADAGLIIPYLDINAMATGVLHLLQNDDERKLLGARAQSKVSERHYVNSIAPKLLELLPKTIYQTGSSLELYKNLIDDAQVVSFDIFDTLLTRQVADPEVVFDLIEYKYTASEPAALSLIKERMDTAGRVLGSYLGKVDDISIDLIYENMSFFNNSTLEKETEVAVCVPHPLGMQLYNYAKEKGKIIYIASDMYLDQTTIEAILKSCGYSDWDQLFLSSTLGKKKETGKLYEVLLEHAGDSITSNNSVVHIGDNWEGDVRQAKKAGLVTKRFAPINEHSQKMFTLPLERKQKLSQKGRIWNSFCEQQCNLWHKEAPTLANDFYTNLGFELTGPLASMMAIYVKAQAKEAGIRNIVFMARDGRIIKKAFDLLYEKEIADGQFISNYLHLSRATVVPATLQHPLSSNDISFLLDGLHLAEKTLGFFIQKAGLCISDVEVITIASSFFESIDTKPNWDDFKKLSDMFRALSEKIYAAHQIQRQHFLTYLTENGVFSEHSVMFVDVGWLLNIQARIETFVHNLGAKTKITGCYVGSRDRVNKSLAHSGFLFEHGDPYVYANFIEANTTLFEILFSAPEPTAKGLTVDEITGKCRVDFKPIEMPLSSEFVVAQKIQMGAEDFFKKLKNARDSFFPEILSRDYFFHIFEALTLTKNNLAKANLGHFEVRLGGDHEFVVHQELIKNEITHLDYELKVKSEYFAPMDFPANNETLKIVIVTSAGLDNGSTRYRALNLAESLSKNGMSCSVIHAQTSEASAKELISIADTVIFQRCFSAQGNVGLFYRISRELSKYCVAEIDDLVFPQFVSTIGSVAGGEWNIDEAMFVAQSYEDSIKLMDACIVSTPVLKKHVSSKYSLPCHLFRNKLSAITQIRKTKTQSGIKLIYASGTFSHKEDFMLIEQVLYDFLKSHPSATLSALGAAQISERILALPNVSNYPILEYSAMLSFISQHDLMLVPLVDNIFNRAKSNVKFIECGVVGVPVLASKVGEFDVAIQTNKNGFLAKSADEWTLLLNQLATQPDRLTRVASNARSVVMNNFTIANCEIKPRMLSPKAFVN
jgi:predicted HAD superfamily hydrolase/glycosyltransferase involved in cell wall biosynthesis